MIRNIFDLWRAFVWWLRGPNNRKAGIACLAMLALCLAACEKAESEQGASPVIAVLDVEKVLQYSKAAAQGREHLAAAKTSLESGWAELQKKWQGKPEKQRKQVLANGLRALKTQMATEEAAARKVVLALMQKKVQEWSAANRAACVIARQNLLDAAGATDATDAVIALMDKETPKFAELPKVTVHEPKVAEQAKPATQPGASAASTAKPVPPKKR